MKRRQLKLLARLYAANVIYNSIGLDTGNSLTNKEFQLFVNNVEAIAFYLLKNIDQGQSLKIGTLQGLIDYVKNQK